MFCLQQSESALTMATVNNFISLVFKCMDLYVTFVHYDFMVTSAFHSGFSILFLCDVIQHHTRQKITMQRQSRKYSSKLQSARLAAQLTFIVLNATHKDGFQSFGKQDIIRINTDVQPP
jgi:hypothetical protein